jgi:disulfide bond formation protein DsbB
MKHFLINLSHQRLYWIGLVVLGLAFESSALYFQYVLDEWPCVLCIHIRILVFGFVTIGLIATFCTRWPWALRSAHALNTVVMMSFVERSWMVLAVERGWVFGDCDMDSGLPPWFALDQWFPALFEVQTACGYTPLILFNITIAEVLMVASIGLCLFSALLFGLSWIERK